MTQASPRSVPSPVRPEIQALRAIAVSAVVLHHFWPVLAPAGYIGVDVFFVVSGFLITGILLRDVAESGRIRFARFYARRVRRILPAALVVLAATAAATAMFVPAQEAGRWFRSILASTLFVENWQALGESQQAGAAALPSTPVEHYWSLSVEEQFYLLWPLVLLAAVWLAARLVCARRVIVVAAIAVLTGGALVASVVLTAIDNNLAYFSTFSRAWEFGAGGLLACFPAVGGRERMRSALSWGGIGLIGASVYVATDVDAFPGLLALLPVAGTVLVIWAGAPRATWSSARVAVLRPVVWLGAVSYSLYLWHWPVVVLTPHITGRPSGNVTMLVLLVVALLLAWATTRWVEDPIRFGTPRHERMRTRTVLVGAVAAAALLVGGSATASNAALEERERLACTPR